MDIQVFDFRIPPEDANAVLADRVWPTLQPHWSTQKILRKEFTGGYINKMAAYYVESDVNMDDALVVRLFGERGEGHYPRELEFINMQISHFAGTFPRIRAVCKNGVIYKYAKGNHVDLKDPKAFVNMARALAQFHWIDVSKCSLIDMQGNPTTLEIYDDLVPGMRRLYAAYPLELPKAEPKERYGNLNMFQAIERELPFMESFTRDLGLPIAKCHAEPNNNNVIYDKNTGDVIFVDYEFSGYGCPATFDFSYIFSGYVWAHFVGKFALPQEPETEENRRAWMKAYLQRKCELEGRDFAEMSDTEFEMWMTSWQITDLTVMLRGFVLVLSFLPAGIDLPIIPLLELLCDTYFERKPQLASLREKYLRLKAELQ